MRTRGTIRLATRGSDLARRQAATVAEALEDRRYEVELVEVSTAGDRVRDELIQNLGKTGAFVRSLDEQVLSGDVDAAVHSMKDMPTESPDDLVVAGIPERGPPGDVLVTPDGTSLEDLPEGATVGTSSLRRKAQLLSTRPDLAVVGLRGNVDTRVEKLLATSLQEEHEVRSAVEAEKRGDAGDGVETLDAEDVDVDAEEYAYERSVEEWFEDLSEIERRAMERAPEHAFDAIVLAEAGLERLGLSHHVRTERLPVREFVPAAGQGALAVTSRDDDVGEAIHDAIDHARTRVETTAERSVLAGLNGGCIAPIGVYGVVQGAHVSVTAAVYDERGETSIVETRDLPVESHATAAREFAADLRERGADDLVAKARED
ncbi:hydroxymethylbilane synthase [Halorubellus sp. JP-L1]|uniref:hydroxymethylbilane synthase n=1 Tax=Halorubellus sp. JP-L1 TaxID=2715753 RepID=UPI001407C1AD|nr:hydroxymethylbilane synthase [Halorubellus sp. JP-L1]NHN43607.1 hydroxymethylbilane synthase [Halorubellus sp. JP-L1]